MRAVAEHLVIDHGRPFRRRASSSQAGQNIYVPYTLGGETVEVAQVAGHRIPTAGAWIAIEQAVVSGADRRWVLPALWRLRGLRDPALGSGTLPRLEARSRQSKCWRGAKLDCDRPSADRRPWPRPAADHAACKDEHARRAQGRFRGGRLARHRSRRPAPSILAPSLGGALDAARALAEPLISIGKPLDIQITATDGGLDVDVRGSGPVPTKTIAALSRVAEAQVAWPA